MTTYVCLSKEAEVMFLFFPVRVLLQRNPAGDRNGRIHNPSRFASRWEVSSRAFFLLAFFASRRSDEGEEGEDREGMIHNAELSTVHNVPGACKQLDPSRATCLSSAGSWYPVTQVGQLPWLAKLLRSSPYLPRSISRFNRPLSFSIERLNERHSSRQAAAAR